MKKNKDISVEAANLRRRAEEHLTATGLEVHPSTAEPDVLRLVHELQVHQLELEMQNKQLQQARAEALSGQEQYTDLYDFAPVGYFTLDRDSIIRKVNFVGAEIFGQPRSRLVGRNIQRLISLETRPLFCKFLVRILEGHTRETCIVVLRADGGDKRYVRMDAVISENKNECRVVAVDITAHKQDEEALRMSEERFRLLFKEAPLGVALIDSMTGHIYEVNTRFAQIAGRSVEQMATIDWMSITHPEDVQADLDNMALLNAGMNPGFQMEKRYLHPDGTVVWISMTIASIQVEDKTHPLHLCMIDDITERKQTEQEKRRFYRDTIRSVTQGKLDLVSFEEVKEYLDPAGLICNVDSSADCATARNKIVDFCISSLLNDDRLGLFESAVGEAITNAIKHANGCQVFAGIGVESIWVAISDSGQGISHSLLPSATLRRGFSSKVSMGMGYTIMMNATDNIMLCTGLKGTTVVLSVNLNPSRSALSLDNFPDTWDEIADV
jgi:PAS domain S-box-containing protein